MRRHNNNSYQKGHRFEAFCCDLFSRMGYQVERSVLTGDGGIDISMTSHHGKKIGVECKNERTNAGRPYVQKLHSALIMRGFSEGWLVTSADFSREAVDYAVSINKTPHQPKIRLVNGTQLKSWNNKYKKRNFRKIACQLAVALVVIGAILHKTGLI